MRRLTFFLGTFASPHTTSLHKPHVPWIVPKEFYDMMPPAEQIPLAEDTYAPVGMPPMAWHYPADVRGLDINYNGTCNETISRLYRRAYYAAVAYQDYNIGKVLAVLEELGFYNNTVVSIHGDHVCCAAVEGSGFVCSGLVCSGLVCSVAHGTLSPTFRPINCSAGLAAGRTRSVG